ncbi:MAG: hypothetical protein HUU02_10635 [Bacteroidetes bacterium]|nr:hypothetical protein [Bacteroidota bacterium]
MKHSFGFLIVWALISTGCNNPAGSENFSPVFYGTVVDSQGNPVQNVDVHYIYSVPSSSPDKMQKKNSTIHIMFSVAKRSKVSLSIVRYFRNDSLKTIVNDTLEAGQYSYQADISTFTNGVYVYRLIIDTTKTEKVFFYLNPDRSTLLQAEPLTRTDANGDFSIPYELFGFHLPMIRTNEQGATIDTAFISTSIELLLNKPGYNVFTRSVTVDIKKETHLTFTMVSQ